MNVLLTRLMIHHPLADFSKMFAIMIRSEQIVDLLQHPARTENKKRITIVSV